METFAGEARQGIPVAARAGERDFAGELSLRPVRGIDQACGRMDGAGGQNRTGYARLFRAALYQ